MDSITTLRDLDAMLPELAAEARARAVEFEARRSLAADFTDRLKRAGMFRVLVPPDAGGLGGSLPEWLEIIMALAEADASTAWVSAHAGMCAGLISRITSR
ncbi:MAG: acyl-CoA dehydrogenase family protein [Candidatus Rokuibacteriota bacterium]